MLNLAHFNLLTQDREDSVRLLNKPSMRGIRAGIVEKYSEKAHFVYELLQNADDVAATEVRFLVRKNGLYFIHNGTTHFTVTAPDDMDKIGHINAITAIGDSSKKDTSEAKIGKFGIGFKAVFQYTNTPHIYDPHISFKIRDLIVPILLEHEPHPLKKNDETLFFFPFDRLEKPAKEALNDIEDKLKHLNFPLLFLNHLKKIVWETDNGTRGEYAIETQDAAIIPDNQDAHPLSIFSEKMGEFAFLETHTQVLGKKKTNQPVLKLKKSLQNQQNCQLVFVLDEGNLVNFHKKYPAFCFFPTKVASGLRFMVHAPFLLSDSREGIRAKEAWNDYLIQELSQLLTQSVELLLSGDWLEQASFFQSLPFERADLDPLFAPMSDALLRLFQQKNLLPTSEVTEKVSINNAYLAENKNAQNLCDTPQLERLLGEGARWIFPDITAHSRLWHIVKTYLTANKNMLSYDWLSAQIKALEVVETPILAHFDQKNEEKRVVLETKVIEIWDTLSDEERLNLMQTAEPDATFAAWEEVQDFDISGLENYLNEQVLTLESSLFLWHFLIDCLDNKILNIHNYFGNYTFAWKTQQTVSFDALYLRRLKNTAWLFDTQNQLLRTHANADIPSPTKGLAGSVFEPFSPDFLHEKYTPHPLLWRLLFSEKEETIDRFEHLTDEEKRAIELGKRLLEQGFSTDDLLELRRIKASRSFKEKEKNTDFINSLKKERKKRENRPETEETEQTSSDTLLKKQQELRDELEADLEDKMAQLVEVELLKNQIQESAQYSMAWFKALLRLEYLLAYEKQEKDRSFQIHFEKIELEQGANKTLLLKRPSRIFPFNIEDAGDITLKLQLANERRNLAVEVVSIKDTSLRAKLKSPEDIADIDFSKVRGASLEIQNTIFVLEELKNAFDALPFPDDHNVQTNLTPDIRFIFGPPGTGKTTYLAREEIQPAMLSDDVFKVLALTPTNKAADVLVKKIQHFCGDAPEWLMRFGTTSDISIENAGLLRDKTHDMAGEDHFCVVTTITRFPYDGFNNGAEDFAFKNIAWDIIIVDEASMIGVGYMAYILQQQPQAQFVIGGDPFQIEPVVFAEDWRGENIYSMVRLDAFDPILQRERLFPHPYKVVNLTTQYRSLSTIGGLYSHFAYDSILRHNRFKEHQKKIDIPNLPLKDINIITFPAHKLEIIYRPQLLNRSHYHLYSALLTVELTEFIAKNVAKNAENAENSGDSGDSGETEKQEIFKIGIICPYKAQATLVDKIWASLHLTFKNVSIQTGTIHSFQGDECHLILCLFNPPPTITKSPNAFLNKLNILNVAISRAKDYLIFLMPNENTEGVGNLYQIQRLRGIIQYYLAGVCQKWTNVEIEEILFGAPDFLYDNTFATTHQSVNVYTKAEKKYEIRIEESAIDVQVNVGE